MFTVILDATLHGSSVMTTEAASGADAEALLVERWTAVEPRYVFRPLFTQQLPAGEDRRRVARAH
jgi:hypothetical protein